MLNDLRKEWVSALPFRKKEIEEEARLIKLNIESIQEWRKKNHIVKQITFADEVEDIFNK